MSAFEELSEPDQAKLFLSAIMRLNALTNRFIANSWLDDAEFEELMDCIKTIHDAYEEMERAYWERIGRMN